MIEKVKIVHVEASGRCNSKCPMCSRFTSMGFLQPDLVEKDLEEKIFYKLFCGNFLNNLEHVYFSGVYGDPCLNPNLINFVKHLQHYKISLSIDTNAGYRNPKWWYNLGKLKARVNFSLDGLEDTNHLYRRGVKWSKVISNVQAFVKAGGNGSWTFIVFRHNEHQVDEAKAFAEKLGLNFRIKKTQKFRKFKFWNIMEKGKSLYKLYPPFNPDYLHTNVGHNEHNPTEDYKVFNLPKVNELDNVEIDCVILKRQELFLNFQGYLLPCCFLGTLYHDSPGPYQFKKNIDISQFNLNLHSVDKIKNNLKIIEKTWHKDSIYKGKLITCAQTCGKKFNNRTQYV